MHKPAHLIGQPTDDTLTVASWNSLRCASPEGVNKQLQTITAGTGINVLGLQEVWGTMSLGGNFELPRVVRGMALHAIRHPEYVDGWRADGLVLLSGLAVTHMDPVVLSQEKRKVHRYYTATRQRVCQRAVVEWQGEALTILHPHLSSWGKRPAQRLEEWNKLLEVVDEVKGPAILFGNLNAGASSALVLELQKRMALVGAEERQPTWQPRWLGQSAIGALFGRRLDYIFTTRDLQVVDHGVHDVEGGEHKPVWARVRAAA